MKILVTGSAGHLGEGLVRVLREQHAQRHEVVGVDILESPFTTQVGSISDRAFVADCMRGVDAVIHTATLHKPHVATHSKQAFVDTNITGTLALLEEAVAQNVSRFIFTSTTSTFGHALKPSPGAPAVWINEDVVPIPKNIYGATKLGAEHLCELFFREQKLPCLVLRTSRFFPEDDDRKASRDAFEGLNLKCNELLHRRVDLYDAVDAHLCALERAQEIGFGRYIISATSPFSHDDLRLLVDDAPAVVRQYVDFDGVYDRRGWRMAQSIGRVYVNARARRELGWEPKVDFEAAIARLSRGEAPFHSFMEEVGAKGYHAQKFEGDDGPYPTCE